MHRSHPNNPALVAAIDAHPWPLAHLTGYAGCTPGELADFVAGTRVYGSIPIFLTTLTYLLGLDPFDLLYVDGEGAEADARRRELHTLFPPRGAYVPVHDPALKAA